MRNPTDCGASLRVIKKPRGLGGHSPRWAAEPEIIITIIIIIIIIIKHGNYVNELLLKLRMLSVATRLAKCKR
jgi:hypothetical protein